MLGIGLGCCLLFSLWASPSSAAQHRGDQTRVVTQDPRLAALESRLFELTNAERQKFGLPPLRLSSELVALARRHSADMAAHNELSHDSSTGESLEDRLVGAGFYFSGGGENVARSGSDAAELINRSLMASPEHRKNILDPDFDTIGIGAVLGPGGVFFVTEDFIVRLEVLDKEQSNQQADLRIQEIRRKRSVLPLVWDKKASALAQEMAQARAAGRDLPAIPSSFGELHVLLVVSPRFENLDEHADEIGRPVYREGGLGVAFSRSREDPGGAYFIVLILWSASG
jgi:uncharacterized protein YkwD